MSAWLFIPKTGTVDTENWKAVLVVFPTSLMCARKSFTSGAVDHDVLSLQLSLRKQSRDHHQGRSETVLRPGKLQYLRPRCTSYEIIRDTGTKKKKTDSMSPEGCALGGRLGLADLVTSRRASHDHWCRVSAMGTRRPARKNYLVYKSSLLKLSFLFFGA